MCSTIAQPNQSFASFLLPQEGIEKCEESSQRLKSEGAEIAEVKKQTVEEIDGAFHAVSDALNQRKKKLMKDISVSSGELKVTSSILSFLSQSFELPYLYKIVG